MSYNNTALMETVNNFILPDADFSENFSNEDFAEDFDGLQVNFPRVKIPSGGMVSFEVPGDDPESPDSVKTIEGIIIYNHGASAYWPEGAEYDENVPPLCSSVDGKTGIGEPGGACAVCALNKYGTGVDAKGNPSKGKACKNMRQLYILRSGEYLPILLSLPPTSLRPFNDFMNMAFITRRRPTWSAIVQISLKRVENGSSPYSVACFRKLENITGEQLAQVKQYAESFREQVRMMNQQRAAFTESMSDSTAYDMDSGYQTIENGDHFSISGDETIDGDREDLPL